MLQTLDIPQANDLHAVRSVVNAIRRGAESRAEITDFTGFSKRHVAYRLHAARVLGLLALDADTPRLLEAGTALLATPVGSAAERAALFEAVNRCAVVQHLAPDLLAPRGPDLLALTEALMRESQLSRATADRRARGLLCWRTQILGKAATPPAPPPPPPVADPVLPPGQLSLFG